ncbi:MAG: hypothetical protein ACJ8H8_05675, partial [Geminicoccaceae bacterium]
MLDRGGALGLVGLAFLAILPNLHALLEGAHRLFARQLGLDIPSTLAMVAISLPVGTLASRLRGRGSVPVLALLGLIFLIGILL